LRGLGIWAAASAARDLKPGLLHRTAKALAESCRANWSRMVID
jgi:hypothetical protein